MMTLLGHLLGTALALACGLCLLTLLPAPVQRRAWPEKFGLSYILGVLALAVGLYLIGLFAPVGRAALLAVVGILAAAAAARSYSASRNAQPILSLDSQTAEPWSRWQYLFLTLIGLHVLWVFAMNFSEMRRTDDAFTYALTFARHVFDTQRHVDYTLPRKYPKFPGLVVVYHMIVRGRWDDWEINLVYGNWYCALLLLFYGNLRTKIARNASLIATYILASMPILLNHAILAGYADLPMAAVLTFSGIYVYRWAASAAINNEIKSGRDYLSLAILFTLCLPLIKTEGIIPYFFIALWTLAAAAWWRRDVKAPRPGLIWAALGGCIALALLAVGFLVLIYGAAGPGWLPPDVWSRIQPQNHLAQAWEPLTMHFGGFYNNWQIVGTLVPFALVALAWVYRKRAEMILAQFALLLLGSHVYLFIFGSAFEFLQNGTTINRLYLQIFPSMLFACAVMLKEKI